MDIERYKANILKANKAHQKQDFVRAERLYKIALRHQPDDPTATCLLGTLYLHKEMMGTGVRFLKRAVEIDPTIPEPYINLAGAYRHMGREEDAMDLLAEGMRLHPTNPSLLSNAGSIALMVGDVKLAEERLRAAIEVDPEHAHAHWNLGLTLLTKGNYHEGWIEYDWGFKSGERMQRPYVHEYPEWLGEDPAGKTMLVWGEQGLGDEILFSSCIPQLIKDCNHVIFDCHPRLAPIFERAFPEASIIPGRKDDDWGWAKYHEIDYHVPVGSLMAIYRNNKKKLRHSAYIKPVPERVKEWKKRIGGDLRVGISWRGGSKKNITARRSMALRDMAIGLTRSRTWCDLDIRWVSLQYGNVFEEVDGFRKSCDVDLIHDEWALEEYDETANLVGALDLVITVTTAVGHLAGAMGKEVWALVPQAAPWRWPLLDKSPFYKNVKMYHQAKRYEWEPVLLRLDKDFDAYLKERGNG